MWRGKAKRKCPLLLPPFLFLHFFLMRARGASEEGRHSRSPNCRQHGLTQAWIAITRTVGEGACRGSTLCPYDAWMRPVAVSTPPSLLLSQDSFPRSDSNGSVVEGACKRGLRARRHFIQASHSWRRGFVSLCNVCVRVHAQVRILLRFISMQVSFLLYWQL